MIFLIASVFGFLVDGNWSRHQFGGKVRAMMMHWWQRGGGKKITKSDNVIYVWPLKQTKCWCVAKLYARATYDLNLLSNGLNFSPSVHLLLINKRKIRKKIDLWQSFGFKTLLNNYFDFKRSNIEYMAIFYGKKGRTSCL